MEGKVFLVLVVELNVIDTGQSIVCQLLGGEVGR